MTWHFGLHPTTYWSKSLKSSGDSQTVHFFDAGTRREAQKKVFCQKERTQIPCGINDGNRVAVNINLRIKMFAEISDRSLQKWIQFFFSVENVKPVSSHVFIRLRMNWSCHSMNCIYFPAQKICRSFTYRQP